METLALFQPRQACLAAMEFRQASTVIPVHVSRSLQQIDPRICRSFWSLNKSRLPHQHLDVKVHPEETGEAEEEGD